MARAICAIFAFMTQQISVGLIGAGSMGGALLGGWIEKGVIDRRASAVFDPAPGEAAIMSGVRLNPPVEGLAVDAVVAAIKPQSADDVLPAFAAMATSALLVSVMAGFSVASIAALLPPSTRIIRAMPNLPAAIGAGVTALYAPPGLSSGDRACAEALMRAVGDVVWVGAEHEIDIVTAVSGSGPAYFFLLAEALAEAARAAGLDDASSKTLARATLAGAGAFVKSDPRPLADLRRAVTSPGGTTAAALNILDGDSKALRSLINAAVEAARMRAKALTH